MTRQQLVVLQMGLIALAMLATAPSPWPSREAEVALDAPLDPSLRVPIVAGLLLGVETDLEPGDRVLRVRLDASEPVWEPRNRSQLLAEIRERPELEWIKVHVSRGSRNVELEVSIARNDHRARIAEQWLMLSVCSLFWLFGGLVILGNRHPVASPIFVFCLLSASVGFGLLDLRIPGEAGWLGVENLRARAGLLAQFIIPAALVHFAMRFPAVAGRFRARSLAWVPYAFWGLLAATAQLRFHDSWFLLTMERLVLGAAGLCLLIHGAAVWAHRTEMSPIETSRSGALVVGLLLAVVLPLIFVFVGAENPVIGEVITLGLLAYPLCTGWAIVRYRLLDPPRWLSPLLTHYLASVAAGSIVTLGVLLGRRVGWPVDGVSGVVSGALLGAVFIALRSMCIDFLRARLGEDVDLARLMADVLSGFKRASTPEDVFQTVEFIIHRSLGAARAQLVALPHQAEPQPEGPLACDGVVLWKSGGSPRDRPVFASPRTEDPGAACAEVVFPIIPDAGLAHLVVVSSRADGRPHSTRHLFFLEALVQLATLAQGSVVTQAELAVKVRQKTESIARNLRDRSRVLGVTREISEADTASEVRGLIDDFAKTCRATIPDATNGALSRVRRSRELGPQLETVQMFGEIAIARLDLVAQLRREIERQAKEIAEITSQRLHAEFVRDVAHELRKPTDEIRRIAEKLEGSGHERAELERRILRVSADLSRRLDLLLFHSGVRLDRHRVDLALLSDEAIDRTRTLHPHRSYEVVHADHRLPLVADPSRLQSVLENLLDNAIRATRTGGRISLRTWVGHDEEAQSGGSAWLEIEDDGCGISAERRQAVFQPGVTYSAGGFGLGLALCREIVRLHRGEITVDSEPGRTVFRVKIPQFAERDGSIEVAV